MDEVGSTHHDHDIFLTHFRDILIKQHDQSMPPWNIEPFVRLHSLSYEWGHDESPVDFNFVPHADFKRVRQLKLSGPDDPTPRIMASVASLFPELEELSLRQVSIWCHLCNLCVLGEYFDPVRTVFVYNGGIGLPVRIQSISCRFAFHM